MPDHEFLFEVDLSEGARFDDMLMALGTRVLAHLGYPGGTTTDALAALHAELVRGAVQGAGGCRVQFRAAKGEMQIVVSYTGEGHEWRATRSLPESGKQPLR